MTPGTLRMLAEMVAVGEYIPAGARYNYQATCCDYRLRLFASVADRPLLMLQLAAAADALIRCPVSAMIPPTLWRRPDETPDQYLARCYDSAQGSWRAPADDEAAEAAKHNQMVAGRATK